MPNRPASIKQADITRYIKGAKSAGFEVGAVKIAPDGTVTLVPASEAPHQGDNPCDRLLDT